MRSPGGFGGGGGAMGLGRPWFVRPQDGDQTEAIKFMSDHAPQYWRWVSGRPDDFQRRIEGVVAAAYATYQRLKPDDPDLYNVIVKRVESEDRIFGLQMQLRNAAESRDAVTEKLRSELTVWSDLTLKERRLRLNRLERTVKKEETALAADERTHSREEQVNRRLDNILNGGGGPGFGGPGFRGGDGGNGGNRDGGTRMAEPSGGGDPAEPNR